MSGALIHSRSFEIKRYFARDGSPHYEVVPTDGGYEFFGYSTWKAAKEYAAGFGVALDLWPDFTAYQDAIDVPMDEVSAKQEPFKQAFLSMPDEALAQSRLLATLARCLRNGEQVFFC